MSEFEAEVRGRHRDLLGSLAGGGGNLEDLVAFLRNELLPHAASEERYLYTAVEPLIKAHGRATAAMSIDHEFIERYVEQIEETVRAMRGAGEAAGLRSRLQRLVLQLEAVLRVHLEKEERIYLPLFEEHLSEEEQQRVLESMEAVQKEGHAIDVTTIDVRRIPPPERHPLILRTFEELQPGEAFELVNDHDPRPLYHQFSFERDGEFTWDYLERGPEVWRVRIGKRPSGRPSGTGDNPAPSGGAPRRG